MKKILCILAVLCFLVFCPAFGAEEIDINEIYSDGLNISGADELGDSLPDGVREQIDGFGILDSGFDSQSITLKSVFGKIADVFSKHFKTPLAVGCSVVALLLVFTCISGIYSENKVLNFAVTLGITAVMAVPAVDLISNCITTIKAVSTFMLSFIPVFAAMLSSSGKALTAANFSSVMLVAAEAVSWIASFVLMPVAGIQLALGIATSVSPDINVSSLRNAIKKASNWTLSLLSTVLLGILSIQTAVSGPQDNLTSKTAKFVVGTTVPVVGTAVSEAMGTVRGCLKLLGSSVLIYGVIAVALIVLPSVAELILWRVSLLLCSSVAEVLSEKRSAELLKSVDSCISFILGITVLLFILFVISLTVVSL
jgi:stage III sporulation protein AE